MYTARRTLFEALSPMYTSPVPLARISSKSFKAESAEKTQRAMLWRLLRWSLIALSALLTAASLSTIRVSQKQRQPPPLDAETKAQIDQFSPGSAALFSAGTPGRSCDGRRVFMLDLGRQFHRELLYSQEEKGVAGRGTGVNGGFGLEKRSSSGSSDSQANCNGTSSKATMADCEKWPGLQSTWYDTWANALDVVFHSRMENYPCLVDSEAQADLVYIVYYGSLDISRHLGKNALQRGRLGREVAGMLSQRDGFRARKGRDHFLVVGRPLWDFISNISDPYNPWGSDFLTLQPMKQVKVVTVEASIWHPTSIGAPYTTGFHPGNRAQMLAWRHFVEQHQRPFLFAFGGAVRRGAWQASIQRAGIIRERVFWQCKESGRCRLLDCENPPRACEKDWRVFMQLYLSSTFCIQPHGDSCTRRAVLDGMLAGCIPVVLEKCTIEHQYQWLLGSPDNFSVYVDGTTLKSPPEADSQAQSTTVKVGTGNVMLEEVLAAIPEEKVRSMQKLVLDLIPKITFGGRSDSQGTIVPADFEDAFDATVDHLAKIVREEIASQAQ